MDADLVPGPVAAWPSRPAESSVFDRYSRVTSPQRPTVQTQPKTTKKPPPIAPGRFLLMAGEDGAAWLAATGRAEVDIDVFAVGSDLVCDGDWHALCGISGTGAILVRPDGHVAMRSVASTRCCTARSGHPAATSRPVGFSAIPSSGLDRSGPRGQREMIYKLTGNDLQELSDTA
ncbi:hypothetical protein [Streptomyces sp. R35]|uniref:Uncharacterized protein n=1 Tax=Streptomyces sp. R35 TaxID=3238630 RepID=A0AB39S445_9ACTN